MKIVDSHAHLYFDRFDPDRGEVLARARRAGVVGFVNVGTDAVTSRQTFALAESETDVFPTAGLHPNDAGSVDEAGWATIEGLIDNPRCVGIGETGLDYYRDWAPREAQAAAFSRQLRHALRRDLPVVIHCREAFADTYALVESVAPGVRGVMHCFSGGVAEAERALALGLHVSFAGPLTYKKNEELRTVLKVVPRDRILIETDCPFLPPEGRRGGRNEPSFLPLLVDTVARTLNLRPDEAALLTARNAVALFRLPVVV